ncbi:MAG: TetR/AcrR family transcriptional regulator [Rhodoglobus sp.]
MSESSQQERPTSRMRLLASAAVLFYSQGINATGIDTVIAHAGVAKGSMYHHFASKEVLIAAYLDAQADAWLARMVAVDDEQQTSAERVALVFSALADQVDAGTFHGCPFTNAAIECPAMADVQTAIARYRRMLHDHIASLLRGVGGESLIATVTIIYDGALTSAKLTGRSDGVRDVAGFVRTLIAANVSGSSLPQRS